MANAMSQMPDRNPYDQPDPTVELTPASRVHALTKWVATRPKWMLLAGIISAVVIGAFGLMLRKPSRPPAPPVAIAAKPVSHATLPHHIVSKRKRHAKKSAASHAKKHKKSHRKEQTQN